MSDFHNYGVRLMATDTRAVPSDRPTRQIAFIFGHIADCTEWPIDQYQALVARLVATGRSPLSLTLGDVLEALTATVSAIDATGQAHAQGSH